MQTLLGRTLAKFNQLKRNKRSDNLIMLVWVQVSLFHIAAGSSCTESPEVTRNFVQGSNSKVASVLLKAIPTDSSCYNDSEKVKFDLSTTYHFAVIEEKIKGHSFGSKGVKQVKMLKFCWQWSEILVNTIQVQNSTVMQ